MPSVTILEDEPLIALDLEQRLKHAGYRIAGIFGSNAEAEKWLRDQSPDAAILDIKLRDGYCTGAAEILMSRDIPFLICTGLTQSSEELEPPFVGAPLVSKPIDIDRLLMELECLLAPAPYVRQ